MARTPQQPQPITVSAVVHSHRSDRDGCWKITLEVPTSDGPKIAAIALQNETVFSVAFTPTSPRESSRRRRGGEESQDREL